MIATAMAECQRQSLSAIDCYTPLTPADAAALVTSCSAALSSVHVARLFVGIIADCCPGSEYRSRVTFSGAGAIPAVISALSAHGFVDADVAQEGVRALGNLARGVGWNIDQVVLYEGGLDVLYSIMGAYASNNDLQKAACVALQAIVKDASPAALSVLCDGRAAALLTVAKRNHLGTAPPGRVSVWAFADRVLTFLEVASSELREVK